MLPSFQRLSLSNLDSAQLGPRPCRTFDLMYATAYKFVLAEDSFACLRASEILTRKH